MSRPAFFSAILLLLAPLAAFAQVPSAEPSLEQLSDLVKPILIDALPKVIHESSDNWGHQANVPVGLKWDGLKPSVQKSPRNHGEWKRVTITARDLKHTLQLKIHDLKNAGPDKQTFKVFLAFEMGVEYEQQNWQSGVRLWSGSVRAHARVKLDMDCESTIRIDLDKNHLPELVLRAKATGAKLSYDKLVVEHINGVGGEAAKVIGAAVHDFVKKVKPSLERDLLAKANAAIVKAADTKEVRVGFGSFLKSK